MKRKIILEATIELPDGYQIPEGEDKAEWIFFDVDPIDEDCPKYISGKIKGNI